MSVPVSSAESETNDQEIAATTYTVPSGEATAITLKTDGSSLMDTMTESSSSVAISNEDVAATTTSVEIVVISPSPAPTSVEGIAKRAGSYEAADANYHDASVSKAKRATSSIEAIKKPSFPLL